MGNPVYPVYPRVGYASPRMPVLGFGYDDRSPVSWPPLGRPAQVSQMRWDHDYDSGPFSGDFSARVADGSKLILSFSHTDSSLPYPATGDYNPYTLRDVGTFSMYAVSFLVPAGRSVLKISSSGSSGCPGYPSGSPKVLLDGYRCDGASSLGDPGWGWNSGFNVVPPQEIGSSQSVKAIPYYISWLYARFDMTSGLAPDGDGYYVGDYDGHPIEIWDPTVDAHYWYKDPSDPSAEPVEMTFEAWKSGINAYWSGAHAELEITISVEPGA